MASALMRLAVVTSARTRATRASGASFRRRTRRPGREKSTATTIPWHPSAVKFFAEQIEILQEMVRRGIPCIVLTRNYNPTHPMLAVADERRF